MILADWEFNARKLCSRGCLKIYQTNPNSKKEFKCKNCNRRFIDYTNNRKSDSTFCCRKCYQIWKKGKTWEETRTKDSVIKNKKRLSERKFEKHPSWKNGIGVYIKLAFERYGFEKICNRCNRTSNLIVHHKNRDRKNNNKSNLEILCLRCHYREHLKDRIEKTR